MGTGKMTREDAVSVEQHEREWNEIFDGIHDVVDACAFQDGHIDYDELDAFFTVNKKLADKYGMQCWTNAETFDRDMPNRSSPGRTAVRQLVEIAKALSCDARILIMDEPTRGIDVGAKFEIYKMMVELAKKGIAITAAT